MNQILFSNNNLKKDNSNNNLNCYLRRFFIIILILCILTIFFFLFNYLNQLDFIKKSSLLSNQFADTIKIGYLYPNSSNISGSSEFSVIGKIEITKIHVQYPIFSSTTDDLLKLGVCKLFGPLPNKTGNLCIAGHNYNTDAFFSKVPTLSINDTFYIYDSNDNFLEYTIYDIYEVSSNDISVLNQNTNNNIEATLITCNNTNNNRIIVKAVNKK